MAADEDTTPDEDEARLAAARLRGWTDIHGGPPVGAYWRGRNPETGRIEAIPDLSTLNEQLPTD